VTDIKTGEPLSSEGYRPCSTNGFLLVVRVLPRVSSLVASRGGALLVECGDNPNCIESVTHPKV